MSLPWTWQKDIGGNVNVAELYGYSHGCGCEYMEMGKDKYRGKMEIDRRMGNTCAK